MTLLPPDYDDEYLSDSQDLPREIARRLQYGDWRSAEPILHDEILPACIELGED